MEIPEVTNNHPQRAYVYRTSFWAVHLNWEDAPCCREKSRRKKPLRNTGERQVISEVWLWITYTLHTKGQPPHQCNFTRESCNLFKNHLRRHLDIFYQTLHIMKYSTLYSTTQLYIYSPHRLNSTSSISPKSEPSLKPLEAGSVPKHCVDAHAAQLVQPQGLTSQRKADEKKYK